MQSLQIETTDHSHSLENQEDKKNQPKYYLFDDSLSKNFQILLDYADNSLLQRLVSYFKSVNRFKTPDYYFYIKSLIDFINLNNSNLQKSLLLHFLSTDFNLKFNKAKGYIVGLNMNRISKIIDKNRNFLRRFLQNPKYCIPIDLETIHSIILKNGAIAQYKSETFFATYQIMKHFKIDINFYFIKKQYFKNYNNSFVIIKQKKKKKHYHKKNFQNNYKYLKKWREEVQLKNSITFFNIYFQKTLLNIQNNLQKTLAKIEKMFNETKSSLWSIITSIIYQDCSDRKKEYMNSVINDLLFHQKNFAWSEEILQMCFLIKYCDSAAYRRLWILSNFKLPPPTTIDTHFESKINYVEHCLTNPDDIDMILDSYYENNIDKILKKNDDNNIDNHKIHICIGCDAASLTTFLKVNNDDEKEDNEEEEDLSEKELKQLKQEIFENIINGDFSSEIDPKLKKFIDCYNNSLGDQAEYFFHNFNSTIGLATSCNGDSSFKVSYRTYFNK